MKKTMTWILVLTMVLMLAACGGGQTAGSAQQGSSPAQSGAAASGTVSSGTAETPDASQTPEPSAPSGETQPDMKEETANLPEEAKALAGVVPSLPEGKWDTEVREHPLYVRYVLYGETMKKDDVIRFADAVKAAGYTHEADDRPEGSDAFDAYHYSGKSADGMVTVAVSAWKSGETDVTPMIQVAVNKYTEVPGGTWGNGLPDHTLPQLPAGEWRVQPHDYPHGIEFIAQTYSVTKDTMVGYVEQLKQMGYTNAAEEKPDGYDERGLYKYTAKNADGSAEVLVEVSKMPYDDNILTTVKGIYLS